MPRACLAPALLDTSLPAELVELEQAICARVIGQAEAAAHVVRALARYRAGLAAAERPVAAFLLLGPTGVGKTLTVEVLAELLQGSPHAALKIHCAELRSDHELARMKGSPPGYVGWKECVPLFHESKLREVRLRSDLALVLFDEVEKAHPALWDLLLGLLDKGEVVLNDNTRTDFRRTLIFLTGNTGAREIAERLSGGVGFQPHTRGDIAGIAWRAADRIFSPEFRNRLTAAITYQPLGWEDVLGVCRLELARLAGHLATTTGSGPPPEGPPEGWPRGVSTPGQEGVALKFEEGVAEHVCREGYDPRFGARHVKRAIERLVEDPLANLLAAGRIKPGDCLVAFVPQTEEGHHGDSPAARLRFRKT